MISEWRKYFDALLTLGGNKEAELSSLAKGRLRKERGRGIDGISE